MGDGKGRLGGGVCGVKSVSLGAIPMQLGVEEEGVYVAV